MPDHFFVRRGAVVKGPLEKARLEAALKAGKLLPTDEFAVSLDGPWQRVADLSRGSAAGIPVIKEFTLRKAILASHFVASYECPRCRSLLQSDESDWKGIETCPSCGKRYRISAAVFQQVEARRQQNQAEKAEREAAAAKAMAAKQANREAAAARKSAETRLAAERNAQQSATRQAAESRAIEAATAARHRVGACWYCGGPLSPGWMQCCFCRMLPTR